MAQDPDNKYKITPRDILGGVLFSLAAIALGFLLGVHNRYDPSATRKPSLVLDFIFGHISNPYVLFGLFIFFIILYPIISALCGAIATSNVFGLHRHSFFEKIWPKKKPEIKDK